MQIKNCKILNSFEEISDYICETAANGDLVITMGGGDIYKTAHLIENRFKKN